MKSCRREFASEIDGLVPVSFGLPSSPGQGAGATALTTFQPDAMRDITPAMASTIYDYEAGAIRAQQGKAAPGAGSAVFKSFADPVAGYRFGGTQVQFFSATLRWPQGPPR